MKDFWGVRFSHILLVVAAMILSTTTFVFATIPLFLLRISLGAGRFAVLVSIISVTLFLLGQTAFWIPFLIASILVALYQQAKDLDCGLAQSGLVSILGTSGIFAFCLGLYVQITDLDLLAVVNEKAQLFLDTLKNMRPEISVELDTITAQIPSAFIMILMIALWLGLVGTKFLALRGSLQRLGGINPQKLQLLLDTKLRDFQLPSFVIWIALPVIAATFIDYNLVELKMIAGNVLNVLLVLYFFHGISIIAVFFRAYEVGIFWQVFWYVILTVHMFLLVSSLGFADFWMNFRSKINKKPAKTA